MRKFKTVLALSAAFILLATTAAFADFSYKSNKEHLGGNLTPQQAFEMVQKDPDHTFLVDCRTRPEYQLVGHIKGSYNIPIRFWSNKVGKKGYAEVDNPDFAKQLLAKFNPATDTLIILCRSGNRSCGACNEAIKAGFDEAKVFNLMGGFEGGKDKEKGSPTYGQRTKGSWRNEGLPWSYSMKKDYMYGPDVN